MVRYEGDLVLLAMTSAALILGGGILCLLLVRLVRGRRSLLVILLASYSLRVALALGLYLVSAYELPLFHSLQLPGGFWRFAWDATSYHANGARIAEALRLGTELPQVMVGDTPFIVDNYDFFYLVGLVYWAFGPHPLYVPLLNSILWIAISLVGYGLARRINGEDAGEFAAAIISFWPSSFIWSSQILKDSLTIFLLLLSLKLVIQIWEERCWVALPAAVVLVPAVFLLTRIRFYLVALLILAVVLSVGLTLAVRFREFRWGSVVRALTLIILLWGPFLSARYYVDPFRLLYTGRVDKSVNEILEARPEKGPTPVVTPSMVMKLTVQRMISRSVALAHQIYSVRKIADIRSGYANTGGKSSFATDVHFHHLWDMIAFLPRGLAYAFYAPFPWEWFIPGGDTGVFKTFAGVETLLMVALTPFLLVSVLRAVRSRRTDTWMILIFGTITIVSLAMTVANYGILFRLRLHSLIPFFILVSAYGIKTETLRRLMIPQNFYRCN